MGAMLLQSTKNITTTIFGSQDGYSVLLIEHGISVSLSVLVGRLMYCIVVPTAS